VALHVTNAGIATVEQYKAFRPKVNLVPPAFVPVGIPPLPRLITL